MLVEKLGTLILSLTCGEVGGSHGTTYTERLGNGLGGLFGMELSVNAYMLMTTPQIVRITKRWGLYGLQYP